MRDIKFRLFGKNSEEFLRPENAGLNLKELQNICDIDLWHVMQFTGFQDSKGQDIYEGDIVYVAGFGDGVASICYANGAEFTDRNGDYRSARNAAAEGDIGEILGNIYQNQDW